MRLSSFSTISTTVKSCSPFIFILLCSTRYRGRNLFKKSFTFSSLYYCVVLVTEDATSLKKVLPFPYFRRFLRYLSVFNHV